MRQNIENPRYKQELLPGYLEILKLKQFFVRAWTNRSYKRLLKLRGRAYGRVYKKLKRRNVE